MSYYYLELPGSDVRAEVEAPSTRSAQTSYLDYLTRNNIVPWKGRNALRPSIIVDRIESGSMPVDVNLDYNLDSGGITEPSMELGMESQEMEESPMESEFETSQVQVPSPTTTYTPRSDRPATLVDIPEDLPTPKLGINNRLPIQKVSRRGLSSGKSRIEQLSKSTLGKGRI